MDTTVVMYVTALFLREEQHYLPNFSEHFLCVWTQKWNLRVLQVLAAECSYILAVPRQDSGLVWGLMLTADCRMLINIYSLDKQIDIKISEPYIYKKYINVDLLFVLHEST